MYHEIIAAIKKNDSTTDIDDIEKRDLARLRSDEFDAGKDILYNNRPQGRVSI